MCLGVIRATRMSATWLRIDYRPTSDSVNKWTLLSCCVNLSFFFCFSAKGSVRLPGELVLFVWTTFRKHLKAIRGALFQKKKKKSESSKGMLTKAAVRVVYLREARWCRWEVNQLLNIYALIKNLKICWKYPAITWLYRITCQGII